MITDAVLSDEIEERRGASGARVVIGPNHTVKYDVGRTGTFVRDQGAWLSRWSIERGVTVLPKVTEVFATGYTMETIDVPRLGELDVVETCERIISMISHQLWPKETTHRWDHDTTFMTTHRGYVRRLLRDVEEHNVKPIITDKVLRTFYDRIDWRSLQPGLTHGDCIVDNVGFRQYSKKIGGEIVILDPIPAKDPLPNWRAVDVGRIIQSMVGYESVRYRRESITLDYDIAVATTLNWYMPKNFDVNEARAAVYFSIIHMLRGVRTTTPGTSAQLGLRHLVGKLVEVAQTWMR